MSDTLIIACLAAGCFVLWLFLGRRRKPAPAPSFFIAPEATMEPRNHGRPIRRAAPIGEPVSRTYTLVTSAGFSPAWHNEKGWPAKAVEYFPDMGPIEIEKIQLTADVTATYKGPGLADLELHEIVKDPPELTLKSLQPAPQERIKAAFEIGAGILERAKKDLPDGYAQIPETVSVDICMELTGKTAA